MQMKKIPLDNIDNLKKFNDNGGQGTIYLFMPGKLVKIYDYENIDDIKEVNDRLESIGRDSELYQGLEWFCSVPEEIIQSQNGRPIGFTMKHFDGFEPLGALYSTPYCLEKKITIQMVAKIFLAIHDRLSLIHSKGFLIADLNSNNVLFKISGKSVHLAFVDVDSWGIKKPGLNLPASDQTHGISHPELEKNPNSLERYHDWYSYSVLLARSLLKKNPFNLGVLDAKTEKIVGASSQEEGITCWDSQVILTKEEATFSKRFGSRLTNALNLWLKGKQKGVFPKEAIERFVEESVFCKKCKLEVHIDHVNCTRCGEKLPEPFLPARKKIQEEKHFVERLVSSGG